MPKGDAVEALPSAETATNEKPLQATDFLRKLPEKNSVALQFNESRADPFSPIEMPLAQTPIVLQASQNEEDGEGGVNLQEQLKDFKVTGLAGRTGKFYALIQYKGASGEASIGQEGGKTSPFLPDNWKIMAIDAQRGQMTMINTSTRDRVVIRI